MTDIILQAGRAAVELAFFILLPMMIVMLAIMRLLEAKGILQAIVDKLTPILMPLGIPGLGIFALLQVLFVSFAAPLATLAMMDKNKLPYRHIAATLALVFGAAQANAVFPMTALGLNGTLTIAISAFAALLGAAATYHWFARHLPDEAEIDEPRPKHRSADDAKGVLDVINHAGGEAFGIAISALPMLVISLCLVYLLRDLGAIAAIETFTAPFFSWLELPSSSALIIVTKAIAGGTAMLAVSADLLEQNLLSIAELNRIAGLTIHPFDLAGIAIFISAGSRVAKVLKPAIYGALIAITIRSLAHFVIW